MKALLGWFARWLRSYSLRHSNRSYDKALTLCEACPGGTLLDVGSADGGFTVRVAEKVGAAKVIAIDAIPANVAALRAKGIEGSLGNLDEGWPLPDASVDVVVASHIIEHMGDTDLFIKECFRVLRGGGDSFCWQLPI